MSNTSSDKENHCKCCDKCKGRINFLTTRVNCLEQALKELSSLVNTVQCKMDSKANKVSCVATTTFAAALDKARASTLNGCEIALEPKNVAVTSERPSSEDSSKSKSSSATRSSVTAGISHQKVSNCASSNKVSTQGSNLSKNSARISSINYPSSSGRSLTNDSATSSPTLKPAQTRNDPLPSTSNARPRAEMDNPVASLSTRRSPPPSSASSQGETRNISPQTYSSQCSISNIERNEHLGNAPKNVRNLHLDLFADNHGRGIGSLVKDSLNVSITEAIKPGMTFNQVIIDIEKIKIDNFCQDKIFEAVAIKNIVEKITILTVYRSDGNVLNFTDKLDKIIAGMSGKIIVAGDFNIDFLTNECNNLESCLSSHNLVKHVHVPTRQKACLDNVLSNVECIETKVEDEGKYSDHSMIIFKFRSTDGNMASGVPPIKRSFSRNNTLKFQSLVKSVSWAEVFTQLSAGNAFKIFHEKFCSLFNQAFPLINRKAVKHRQNEWYNEEIDLARTVKHELYNQSKNNLVKKSVYLDYLREYKALIDRAKREHFGKVIHNASNKGKASWRLVNENLGKGKQVNTIKSIVDKGVEITEATGIAKVFNSHFVSAPVNLVKSLYNSSAAISSHVDSGKLQSRHTFKFTNENEVVKAINDLSSSGSSGFDDISVMTIKSVSKYVVPVLVFIINLILATGEFSDILKIAKVIPLHKKDDKKHVSNYRPISILSNFGKIIEKIIYWRL
ncbi:uncharacterized protein [Bemisia tabaci]|uniref:uncharacterized protein n=1 Tax=Bemisia tabaci TaxID=7038 RepID=UPI003B27E09D